MTRKHFSAFWVSMVFTLAMILPSFALPVMASESRYYNYTTSGFQISGDGAADMVAIGMLQKDRSDSSLGYVNEAWCADFVCDCAIIANQQSAIPFNGNCAALRNAVINAGGNEVFSPQAGDLVFYYCNSCGRYVHVGLMTDSQHSIQGNYSDKVSYVTSPDWYSDEYKHTCSSGTIIYSFIRPNYENTNGMNIGDDFYAVLGTSESWAILGNNNGNVEIVKETGEAYNVWHFIRCPDNSYVIYSCLDNKVIDAHNMAEESNVDVTSFADTDSQHWYIYSNGNGAVYLQPKNTSNVLDVKSSSSEIGTNVQLYRYNGTNAQHFTIYQVDKAEAGNLYIDAGNTISGTKFWWDKGTSCTIYNLRIEKGEPGNTSSYLDKWNLTDTECTVELPEGYYEAYVDFCNGYSVSMGRKMQFYVSTPIAGVSTISVSPGNKTSPSQFFWTEAENATVYNLRISSIHDGITTSYKDVWNLTDLSYDLILPVGTYEVYVNACVDANYSTSNRITFDVTESIVPDKPIIEVVSSDDFNTANELKWNDCKYADNYAINIYSENMVLVESIDNTTERCYQVDLPNGVYIAKVTAYNAISQNTSVSDEVYFEVNKFLVGDSNDDGEFTVADVVLLQKWLLAVPDTHLANWQAADLCKDGKLDVFDLCMMKRKLING